MLRRFSFASHVSGCAPRGSSFQPPTESYDLSVRRAVAHRRERTQLVDPQSGSGRVLLARARDPSKSEVAKLAFLRQLGAHEWDLSDLNPKLCVLLPPQLPPYQPSRMSFNILSVRGLSARVMNFGGVNRGLLVTFCSLSSARLKYRICSLPTI